MKHKLFKRWVAMLLVLAMCVSCVPAAVFAEEGEEETRSQIGTEEQTLEDASAQLGEYTPPAEPEAVPEAPATEPVATEPAATEPAATEPAAAEPARNNDPVTPTVSHLDPDGRADAADQTLSVDGTSYILIGSPQQLEALDYYPNPIVGNQQGSVIMENARYNVTGPIWRVGNGTQELVYPGDNNLVGEYEGYQLYGKESKIVVPTDLQDDHPGNGYSLGDYEGSYHYVCGSLTAPNNRTSYNLGKYSPQNNYIVFRDIDLGYDIDNISNNGTRTWTPLMYYGLMYGVKGSELPAAPANSSECPLQIAVGRIRASASSTDYADLEQPKISNIVVNTPTVAGSTQEIDPERYMGVGFFATLTSSRPSGNSLTHTRVEVRNLRFEGLRVVNNFNAVHIDETLLDALTGPLGFLVGGLLDGLLLLLTGKIGDSASDFRESLQDLLTARARDPRTLATGGFAGRILGLVLVENCDLNDVEVTGAGSYIGGFVGHSEGIEQYDGLSRILGGLLDLLSDVLNLIPGLGLGDLITIVGNILPLGTLIPVDYLNPELKDCELSDLHGSIGPESLEWTFHRANIIETSVDAECNGGFIGSKIATLMIGCGVKDSDYSVYAKNYGGGFAGLARDAVVQELLTDLGVNLGVMRTLMERLLDADINLQSMQLRCYVNDSNVSVQGGSYLGGFNGAMTNAYCVNNEMIGHGKTLSVVGSGDCVGGFAGIATLGWAMNLGQGDQGQGTTSLLSTLKNVVGSLLSSYGQDLLSLLGVGQSYILGLQFDYSQKNESGGEASVTGHDYVGGLVGKGDAVIMTGANGISLSKITFVQHGDIGIRDIYPNLPANTSFKVNYRELDGSTTTQSFTEQDNYIVTLPSRDSISIPAGTVPATQVQEVYQFVGWTTGSCDHSEEAPSEIYYAGDKLLLSGDLTLNALYSRQDYGYQLITAAPTNWEEAYENSYIITYGKDENMVVLTGLDNNVQYRNANSGGASGLSTIRTRGGDQTLFTMENGLLIRVPNLYLFSSNRVAGQEDCYWKNLGKNTYLRRRIISPYDLFADSDHLVGGTQWHISISNSGTILMENDYNLGSNKHLVYDSSNNYFKIGSASDANACDLYIWGKTPLPLKYTTVMEGAALPEEIPPVSGTNDYTRYFKTRAYGLKLVDGHKFVGGLVGLVGTANVGGLLNDTLGVGDFKKFEIHDLEAIGGTRYADDDSGSTGLTVTGSKPDSLSSDTGAGYNVGGGIGMAIGGDIKRVTMERMEQVEGQNNVGGFIGCVGPGELLGTGGLNLQLLGLSLLKANNLLAVGQGLETDLHTVTVTGVPAGCTVEAKGSNGQGENRVFTAGGFFGRSNSTGAVNCHVKKLHWVKANDSDGRAGGFLGVSQVGGLATMDDSEGTEIKGILDAGGPGGLLRAVGYLIPSYRNVDVRYVDDGYVKGAYAGGFAADFQSGTVDNSAKNETDWYAVYNIDHVEGSLYAGGFGAKLYSGALAEAGGGISVLGALDVGSIDLRNLLSLVSAYVPKIIKAGVNSDKSTKYAASEDAADGFVVKVTGYDRNDKRSGAAGGFAGYGSGAQISYSDVRLLRHTEVTAPDDLDGKDGASYFTDDSAYAVTGTRYAGGYAGFLDIGASASLGGGLKVLGDGVLNLNNALNALSCVISTVEHSDVYGAPGGFAVRATASVEGQGGQSAAQPQAAAAQSDSTNASAAAQPDSRMPVAEPQEENENLVTVYVVDQTGTGYENFRAYIFNSVTLENESVWTGRAFTQDGDYRYLNSDKDGNPAYSFTVDRDLYDRVIFNDNSNNNWNQDGDATCLMLDSRTVRTVYNVVDDESGQGHKAWKVVDGDDIWLQSTSETHSDGCSGSYTRYIGVRGTILDVQSNPSGAQHTFTWVHTVNTNNHIGVCQNCGFTVHESCSFDQNNVCSKCGAHKLCDTHSFVWTHVSGTDSHQQICSVCQAEGETASCSYTTTHIDGTETHALKCSDCGYEKEKEPCSFNYVHVDGTDTHKRVCPECQYETEAEACAFVAVPVAGVNQHRELCERCGNEKTPEDCSFPEGSYYCEVCGRRDVDAPEDIVEKTGLVGRAGGFVGWMRGAHIQDSDSLNFSYIIGRIAAGGYAGEIEPGSVADAVGDTSILGGLANVNNDLLTVGKDFVPSIRNSQTTSIPCGGAVRADAASGDGIQRGMAGGYVGHNCGGQIWGNDDHPWKDENISDQQGNPIYDGPYKECAAVRILSVYGVEYAGGFTGLMDAGSTAGTGNISLLFDLVKLNGLLNALKVSYPTEENTAVYGPLAQMDYETWNSWVEYVGQYGGYGMNMEHVESQAELDAILGKYLYGYHVTAGRSEYVNEAMLADSGCAGGYVGSMRSGTVTNGQAHDVKQVKAMRNAGGFAGELKTGSVANLGGAELLDSVKLNLDKLLSGALQVFVPVVKTSSVYGYQNGMSILASGDSDDTCGNAGGFAGTARGAQIWGDADDSDNPEDGCNVFKLKSVQGTRYVGGYIGSLGSGSTAELGTDVSDGPLQELLNLVVQPGVNGVSSLLNLVNATVSTVRYASVDVADPAWGFTVGGFDGNVPLCAGGFIGTMEGAILGNNGKTVTTNSTEGQDDTYTVNDPVNITDINLTVNNLRGVQAQYYAGGFVGMANVGGAASVAGDGASILKLINLDQISALDIFRPYIFNSRVTGVDEGFTVSTMGEEKSGVMCSSRYSGCSGGFAGAVLDGTVKNCQAVKLSQVDALNYAGGFVGHSGKSGLADVDGTQISQLAALNAGIGDSFGTYIKKSSVTGVDQGYTVNAAGGHETVAGGFVGYADLAKIGVKHLIDGDETEASLACAAEKLKYVKSEQYAGGFVGKTTKGYLVELQASSPVVALLLNVVNVLVQALYLPEAERANLLDVELGNLVGVELLNEGNLLGVKLLGIRITVALGTKEDEGGATDVAKITIGDSYIELPCNENGLLDLEHSNLTIRLIPLFYTNIKNCTVSAADTAKGYDVFGGGADQEKDGTHRNGYAGGFAGFNHLGEIENCAAVNCDVVRGTPAKLSETATVSVQKVGPFTGCYYDDSIYNANGQTAKETGDTYNGTSHTQEAPGNDPEAYAAPFVDTAKVQLKSDDALLPNAGSLMAPTPDMQNPCLPTVDLTLNKVWADMDGLLGERQSVSFTIWQVPDGDTTKAVAYGEPVTLTEADLNTFTGNCWTKLVSGLPASETVDGELVHYSYYVTENAGENHALLDFSYADYNAANKLSYDSEQTAGYAVRAINVPMLDQTVVIDFGLPVQIHAVDYLENLLEPYRSQYDFSKLGGLDNLELVGLLPISELGKKDNGSTLTELKVTRSNNHLSVSSDTGNSIDYGTFSIIPGADSQNPAQVLRFVPGSMQITEPVQIAAVLRMGENGGYYYTKVTVVPATMIYFEDDFISFSSEWTEVGTAADGEQDEDRPGADQLDLNSIYGYDSQYANSSTYSLDSARMVTVTKGMTPSASFTFTGTAFDILAVTDKTTGFMTVEVFRGTTADVQNRVAYWAVDTFYGCTREENGYIRYLCVWDEKELKWRVAKTAFPEMTDAEALAKVGTTEDGCVVKNDYPTDLATNHSSFIVYKKNYVWVTNGSNNTVYQVPVISTRNGDEPLPYGTYTVVLKPQYASFFDHDTSDASYKVYLDGVRIYGPAEGLDAEYYLQDHEGWPQFIEMRKLLLGQEGFGQTQDGEEQSIVYIDGGITVSDISDFAQYGPNNEIYLDPGQAIAFRLEKGNSAKVDQIHVSMKRVFSGEAKISFTSGTDEALRSTELTLNTASECYYDLSSVIQWAEGSNQTDLIIISNTGESGTVSLRNLKISYKEAVANENDLVHVVKSTPNTAMEALRLLRRSATLPIVLDEDPAFLGASISLESDFSLHFYIPAAFLADKTNPYVVFTKQTADGPVVICQYDYAEETVGEKLCRRYSFPNLSAAEMGTEVTARLFYNTEGADHMSHALSYSVRQYAMNMLEKTDDAALKTLLVDMLNYGAEAQKYFGVNESSLANSGLTEAQQLYATEAEPALENHKSMLRREDARVWFEGCSLSLERSVTLNYYLDLSTCGIPANELALELSWLADDGSVKTDRIDGTAFLAKQLGNRSLYVAVLDELNAAQMRTVVSAAVIRKEDQMQVSDTMCYSIESYAQSKMKNDPALAVLILAMMKYGDAAESYFSNH